MRKGVQFIRQAFDKEEDVRKFVPPQIDFKSNRFCDMVDLDSAEKTEPPVTRDLPDEVILSALTAPLILPAFPNNTQGVERMVRVVTLAAVKRAGHAARHRLILHLLQSRKRVGSFNTKKDDAVFSQ